MFGTRCKSRWPAAATAMGSSCAPLARLTVTARAKGPPSRWLGTTTASPQAAPEAEQTCNFSVTRRQRPFASKPWKYSEPRKYWYTPRAHWYKPPRPMSYADILRCLVSRVIQQPIYHTRRSTRRAVKTLVRGLADATEPAERREHVVELAMGWLTRAGETMQAIASAVGQDVSSGDASVPRVYSHDPAALSTHALGRLYAASMLLRSERVHAQLYLAKVRNFTEQAAKLIFLSDHRPGPIRRALAVQKDVTNRLLSTYQREVASVLYDMVREWRSARKEQQWHKVWTLERRLASTATLFLCPHPIHATNSKIITEISMSRMAGWDESYQQLYQEDAHARKAFDTATRYQAIIHSGENQQPWEGKVFFYTVRSIRRRFKGKGIIVIRHDQSQPPSPLWPRGWVAKVPAGEKAEGGRDLKHEGETGEGSESEIQQRQPSPDLPTRPDAHEG